MDAEPNILLCVPVRLMPVSAVPGATKAPCSRCQAEVWVTPASRAALPQGEAYVIVCLGCLSAEEQKEQFDSFSPGQIQEVFDQLNPDRN